MDIFMRFPEGKRKALTLSYDDGVEQDIRLIEIMRKYDLKGTFNVNSGLYVPEGTVYPKGTIHRRMTKQKITEVYKDSGMEPSITQYTKPQKKPSKDGVWHRREKVLQSLQNLRKKMALRSVSRTQMQTLIPLQQPTKWGFAMLPICIPA